MIHSFYKIFQTVIADYHVLDSIDTNLVNPFDELSIENLLYQKCWIDTVQWHCEDEVRNPLLEAEKVRFFKNKIDNLNQLRTNLVEKLDDFIQFQFQNVKPSNSARVNTESPAWALDRLSILALKIYHMSEEVNRTDLTDANKINYTMKFNLLKTQQSDLISSIQSLFDDIRAGLATYHIYRQVKMYNDSDLNPILRNSK